VGEVDAVHRRARADQRVERHHGLVRVLLGQPVHQVYLGAHGDGRPRRQRVERLDDVVGGADLVGEQHGLVGALGVHDHDAVGVLGPEGGHVVGREPLVDRAVAPPQQEAGVLAVGLAEAAPLEPRVPHPHLVEAVAHGDAGVAAQVLVGEEQHLVALLEGPLQDGAGVGRGAHGPAVAADERLQRRRRVHVGDGDDPLDVGDLGERLPGLLDLVDVGHVGHGAAGVEVREDHLLAVVGEYVGRLGHEVHTAEHDELGLGPFLGQHRQPVRVAAGVGPPDDLVALVVVPEDEEAVAERGPGLADAAVEFVGVRGVVVVHQRDLEPKRHLVLRR
jgi:hypothetical protein